MSRNPRSDDGMDACLGSGLWRLPAIPGAAQLRALTLNSARRSRFWKGVEERSWKSCRRTPQLDAHDTPIPVAIDEAPVGLVRPFDGDVIELLEQEPRNVCLRVVMGVHDAHSLPAGVDRHNQRAGGIPRVGPVVDDPEPLSLHDPVSRTRIRPASGVVREDDLGHLLPGGTHNGSTNLSVSRPSDAGGGHHAPRSK